MVKTDIFRCFFFKDEPSADIFFKHGVLLDYGQHCFMYVLALMCRWQLCRLQYLKGNITMTTSIFGQYYCPISMYASRGFFKKDFLYQKHNTAKIIEAKKLVTAPGRKVPNR